MEFSLQLFLNILQVLFISVMISLATSFLSLKIAPRLGLMDIPGSAPHKKHTRPTPLGGGISLALALVIAAFLFGFWRQSELRSLLLPALIIFAFALWDDKSGLGALPKLIGQTVATICMIWLGTRVRVLEYSGFLWGEELNPMKVILDWGITIFWMVGITNAFNLVDSMDGLVVGLSSWATGFFLLVLISSGQTELALFTVALFGCLIALTLFNSAPAKMFLGDSGAQTIGFLMAGIAILYTPQDAFQESSWFTPIMFLAVPIFDTVLVTFSRIRRGEKFYISHLDHTYHRLIKLGLDSNQGVMLMHLTGLILQAVAITTLFLHPLYANLIFLLVLIAGAVMILVLDRYSFWPRINPPD